jgi:hypothetical protein
MRYSMESYERHASVSGMFAYYVWFRSRHFYSWPSKDSELLILITTVEQHQLACIPVTIIYSAKTKSLSMSDMDVHAENGDSSGVLFTKTL